MGPAPFVFNSSPSIGWQTRVCCYRTGYNCTRNENEPGPISAIQPLTPSAFEHVVTTCLAKDPDDRFQTRLVEAWAELHQNELLADWETLQQGRIPQPIDPLK